MTDNAQCPGLDELVVIDTEPCQTCGSGIAKMTCYDGYRRCQSCVTELSTLMGW